MNSTLKRNRSRRGALVTALLCALMLCSTVPATGQKAALTTDERAALERVSADSLRGHLSFISSDALEGRNTPSRGLDLAAEYIAAQFRRAGLEPAGDDNYFQTANWSQSARDMRDFELKIASGAGETRFDGGQSSIGLNFMGRSLWSPDGALALSGAGVVKVDYKDAAALSSLTTEAVAGKVVLTQIPDFRREDRSRWMELYGAEDAFMRRMGALGATLVVSADAAPMTARDAAAPRLFDPENKDAPSSRTVAASSPAAGAGSSSGAGGASSPASPAASASRGGAVDVEPAAAPLIIVHGTPASKIYDELKTGGATLTVNLHAPQDTPVRVRNVAGVLRGSDPTLKDTYVIVSAHYDHLGVREGSEGDRIFNGANDDGSGTVGVVELASVLSTLKVRPKRSILFMTFFGEEKGLLGSRYYGRHPLVPLRATVAQINLEQIGRTDDSEGPQVGTLAMTGLDYSDVGGVLVAAGETAGVKVFKHPAKSDAYFGRSDNQALADVGIPAHTVSVAFDFPDYHAVGDEWQKIDYANMSKVVRAVGAGLLLVAGNAQAPKWNEANVKTARYVQAWKELHR
ncbi:MAG: M28 family peptidase [Pyrinomonadaceae bacterium]